MPSEKSPRECAARVTLRSAASRAREYALSLLYSVLRLQPRIDAARRLSPSQYLSVTSISDCSASSSREPSGTCSVSTSRLSAGLALAASGASKGGQAVARVDRPFRPARPHQPLPEELAAHEGLVKALKNAMWAQE